MRAKATEREREQRKAAVRTLGRTAGKKAKGKAVIKAMKA